MVPVVMVWMIVMGENSTGSCGMVDSHGEESTGGYGMAGSHGEGIGGVVMIWLMVMLQYCGMIGSHGMVDGNATVLWYD
jgi:hypothetical protein